MKGKQTHISQHSVCVYVCVFVCDVKGKQAHVSQHSVCVCVVCVWCVCVGSERKAGTQQPAEGSSSEHSVCVCVPLCRFLLWPRSLEGGPAPCKLRGKFQHRLLTEHHSG